MAITYAVVPFPGFPLMAFSSVIEPLRSANRIAQKELYRWIVIGAEAGLLQASCGISVQPDGISGDDPVADRIVVCSGGDADQVQSRDVVRWMRRSERAGSAIGAVADGAFFLARNGFLDGHACTLHWTSQPSFAESFPMIDLRRDLYVIDGKRFTSAGGVGSLDMMLEMIEGDFGKELATGVAEWFVHSQLRSSVDRRLMPIRLRTGVRDELVLSAIAIMEDTVEERLRIPDIAAQLNCSTDRLGRAFRAAVGMAPNVFYRRLRLRRAADLLAHSSIKVRDAALVCGFENMSSFSRAFKEVNGCAPSDVKRVEDKPERKPRHDDA